MDDPNKKLLDKIPNFDVVYSWGVLHHTEQCVYWIIV